MSHGCRLAIIRVVTECFLVHSRDLGPHGAHGHFVELLHFHAIGHKGAAGLVRLAIVAYVAPMQHGFQLAIVFVGDEVANGLAEVPQELVAGCGALYHLPGQNRHPRRWIIAAQLLELGDHIVGPVLRTGFPAIVDYIADALLAHPVRTHCLLVAVQIGVEVLSDKPAVQLVHFKTGGFCGGGVVGDAQQGIADAKHGPMAGRRRPVQGSIGTHLRGQVDYIGLGDCVGRVHRRRGETVKVRFRGESCLLFKPVHTRPGMKHELNEFIVGGRWANLDSEIFRSESDSPGGNRWWRRALEGDAEKLRRHCSIGNGMFGGTAAGKRGDGLEVLSIVAGLKGLFGSTHSGDQRRNHVRFFDDKRDGANGLWRRKFVLNPGTRTRCRDGQFGALFQVAI